jgi:putative sigma-54 modulation protein
MNLDISFRHLEHTEAIDDKIRAKLDRVSKKFSGNAHFKWTSWIEHNEHISTLHANDNGKEFFVKASSDNLYKTIDQVIHKMESQLEHHSHG